MQTTIKISLIFLIVFLALGQQTYACWPTGDVTWTGENSSDWNDAGNYNSGWWLPGNRDRVIINPDYYTNPPIVSSNPRFRPASIYLANNAELTLNTTTYTEYLEVGSGSNNVINIANGVTLSVNRDLLVSVTRGALTLQGDGDAQVGENLQFQAVNTDFVNNLGGTLTIVNDIIFNSTSCDLINYGNIRMGGDLTTSGASANANSFINKPSADWYIDGRIDFNNASNIIENDGTISQNGNFVSINAASRFKNNSGGIWNWYYTGGAPDNDMVSVLSAGGTVVYTGNGSQPVLPINYNNLVIKGSGTKTLEGDTKVSGVLTLNQGYLELGDADLTLGNSASIAQASSSKFIVVNGAGRLIQNNLGSGGRTGDILFPVGTSTTSYTPLTINNAGVADNYSLSLGNEIYDGGYAGTAQTSDVVNKTWYIDEAVIGGSDVTLTFQWSQSDQLTGFDPSLVKVIHYDGTEWEVMSEGPASGSGPYTASASNITSFSPFGVEGEAGTLPVELLSFNGELKHRKIKLTWETASELNNDYFSLERSADSKVFEEIARIKGQGTTDEANTYEYYDHEPFAGEVFYRLKQIDFDGQFTYFDIIRVANSEKLEEEAEISIYPIPNTGRQMSVRVDNFTGSGKSTIHVYNTQGMVVYSQEIDLQDSNIANIDFAMPLPSGVYTLKVGGESSLVKQFVVR